MSRKRLTLADKVVILARQAICPLCKNPLGEFGRPIEYDHGWALSRGGRDEAVNIRAVHKDCHAVKTRGSGATTRGSDIGEAAKTKRLAKKEAVHRTVLEFGDERYPLSFAKPKRRIPSRPFQKAKRAFQKRRKPNAPL